MADKEDKIIDSQAAIQFVRNIGSQNIIYVAGSFYIWNGKYWEQREDRWVRQQIQITLKSYSSLTKAKLDSIIDLVKTETYIDHSILNNLPKDVINCNNGCLRITESGCNLEPHNKAYFFTSCLTIDYDSKAEASTFNRYLKSVFLNDIDAKEKRQCILEMFGYTLLASAQFERFIILSGKGSNGKSILLGTLKALVGKGAYSAVAPSEFSNRFQRAHILGKFANIISELQEKEHISSATLKALVSGETITAEHKNRNPFDFEPYATCWFATNHLPRTSDHSDGLFRRTIIIEFNNTFKKTKKGNELLIKISRELPGILNIASKALVASLKRHEIVEPASSLEVKHQWRREIDSVLCFIEEECTLNHMQKTASGEIYKAYKDWCQQQGIKSLLEKNALTIRLKNSFNIKDKKGGKGKRMLYGIALRGGESGTENKLPNKELVFNC